jgi:lyso-ornithine lipid O-acyltransferase
MSPGGDKEAWLDARMEVFRPGAAGTWRIIWRGLLIGSVVYGGLILLLLLRLIEAPIFGAVRPLTPYVTQGVCKAVFLLLGMRLSVIGRPMTERGAIVSNHASWLDIFALNAAARVYFVAKSEVEGWPGIGWLARATGTVFIRRKGIEAKRQQSQFEDRLRAGHLLCFFPEGTSTDGLRILPFKTALFEAFTVLGASARLFIQPATLSYRPPDGHDPRVYAWWSDMSFAEHLAQVLAMPRHGAVEIRFHAPLKVTEIGDRKSLARLAEAAVRDGAGDGGRR